MRTLLLRDAKIVIDVVVDVAVRLNAVRVVTDRGRCRCRHKVYLLIVPHCWNGLRREVVREAPWRLEGTASPKSSLPAELRFTTEIQHNP
ncbi:hypothetical protein DEO72_LG6g353 [Vigna unguiculata]|uniref:Uncharacterized protein n=1 Tax=Vigna unguiculata TaxID=3917 RepID=A0A4D6M4Y4_VIGUN|nr:hypothetical protein DEO72_LG6g353 [Vigna unguiculata]